MANSNQSLSLFEDFYRPFGSLFQQGFPSRLLTDTETWLPAVDIKRDEAGFTLEMEVPGFSSDEIQVESHDDVLTITGVREASEETKEDNYLRRERRYGKFVRRFNLPAGTTSDAIDAQVKDGVLHVSIPHTAPAAPKKIEVK